MRLDEEDDNELAPAAGAETVREGFENDLVVDCWEVEMIDLDERGKALRRRNIVEVCSCRRWRVVVGAEGGRRRD